MSGLQMWLHLDLMEVATSSIHARPSQHIQQMSKAIKKHQTALHSVIFLMHASENNFRNYKKPCTKTLLTNSEHVSY